MGSSTTACTLIPLDDEFVCWDVNRRCVYLANETGALIVQWHCQGWTEQAIAQALAEHYGLTAQQVAADVSAQLQALKTQSVPIQDSEFGLATLGAVSARHGFTGGWRFCLRSQDAGVNNTDGHVPDLFVRTDIEGFAEQLARVFNLPVPSLVDKRTTPDSDQLHDKDDAHDIVVGRCDGGFFISVGASLVAECDNRSALLHYCVGLINTRWTVAQTHDVVLHAAAVSMGDLTVIIPATSGSGKSTLATCLALSGCTFWGDDLIALTNNARAVVPSLACASVKSGSRAVVFDTMQENAQARAAGWHDQSIMLEQVRADLPAVGETENECTYSGVPGCFLFPHYDESCSSLQVHDMTSAQAFRTLVSAGLATHLGASCDGLQSLCQLLENCKKIQIRYSNCDDVRLYLHTLGE